MSLSTAPLESVGGAAIWLLVGFFVITWGLTLVKGVQFVRQRRQGHQFQKQFWSATSLDSTGEQVQDKQGAGARVAQVGFATTRVQDNGQSGLAQSINHQDCLERTLRQQIQREQRSLESGPTMLVSIGLTSPFIGLFGTVWGIMEALKGISAADSASPETVVGPIGSVLIATGMGTAVVVPAVLVYNYLLRCLKLTAADLGDFTHDFYSLVQKSAFRVIVHPSATRQAGNPSRNTKEVSWHGLLDPGQRRSPL